MLDYVSKSSTKYTDYYNFADVKSFDGKYYKQMAAKGFCMLVRSNYFSRKFVYNPKFKDNLFIYSQWLGYIQGENAEKDLVKFVPKKYHYLHTSGHATAKGIIEVCNIVKPKVIIPIHRRKFT